MSKSDQETPTQPPPLEYILVVMGEKYLSRIEAFHDLLTGLVNPALELDSKEHKFKIFDKHLKSAPAKVLEEIGVAFGEVINEDENSNIRRELTDAIFDKVSDSYWAAKAMQAIHEQMLRQARLPILLESIVVSAVGAFEVQLGAITTQFYRAAPKALEAGSREQEKEFSLKDLQEAGSVEKVIDLAIARRVENLLFGSIYDWRKFYKDRLKIDFADISIDWTGLIEIFQRRHIIVHNGGIVSSQYIRRMKVVDRTDKELGQRLTCDEDYAQEALGQLLVLGILLAMAVGFKFGSKPEVLITALHSHTYQSLISGRWAVTRKLCKFGEETATEEGDRLVFRVNRWIATQRMEGSESIREEVLNWDTSAAANRFKLARACLLADTDGAFDALRNMAISDEIDSEALLEWPLLDDLRRDSRFPIILAAVRVPEAGKRTALAMSPGSTVVHALPCRRAGKNVTPVDLRDAMQRNAKACPTCTPIAKVNAIARKPSERKQQ
ncbi:hypothetical protein [Actinomadura geliboluensis]|uniref:hypothetical protein n=1 Tax=Actinomadura geliboluensis TaxID=882440 RepID=UPI0036C7656F